MQGLLASAYVVLILPLVTLGSVKRTKHNDEIYLYLYFYFDHDNHELYMYMYMTKCDKCVVWHDKWYGFFLQILTNEIPTMRDQQHDRLKIYSWMNLKFPRLTIAHPCWDVTTRYMIRYMILYYMMWCDEMWCDVTWPDMARHDKIQCHMTRHDMTWHFMTWHVMIWLQSFSLDSVPSKTLCKIYNNPDERYMLAPRKNICNKN